MNSTELDPNKKLSLPESVKYTISVLVLLVGAAVLFFMYNLREATNEKESDALIPLVNTATVDEFQGDLDLLVSGTVVPFREITVAAQVSGRVKKKYPACEAGNFVTKGTKLLEIDPQDYELEIRTVESELRQADRTMEETEEEIRGAIKNLEIAKTDYALQKREFSRYERIKGAVAATEYDRAKRDLLNSESQRTQRQNTYDMLLARKERLKASKEMIQNRMEKAEISKARTVITAEVDGVIVRESVEPGDFVTVARELLVFEGTSRAEVLCNLTPGELSWIRKYSSAPTPTEKVEAESPVVARNNGVYQLPRVAVKIFDQAEPGIQWEGVLERFDGIGRDERTKSIPCRILVENPVVDSRSGERALVRGMYVKCRMVVPSESAGEDLAGLPAVAVRPGDYVWIVRDEKLNRFDLEVIDRTPVRESLSNEPLVVVSLAESEMRIGDQVIISPLPQPTVGGRVQLKEPSGVASDDGNRESNAVDETRPTEVRTSRTDDTDSVNRPERGQP